MNLNTLPGLRPVCKNGLQKGRKTMKSFLAILGLVLFSASGAQAACKSAKFLSTEVDISYSSFRSAYSCDFVERVTEDLIKKLGGIEASTIRCQGGLPDFNFIHLKVGFDRLMAVKDGDREACEEDVSVRYSNDSCDLRETVIEALSEHFDVSSLEKRGACRDSQGRINYRFSLLK